MRGGRVRPEKILKTYFALVFLINTLLKFNIESVCVITMGVHKIFNSLSVTY